MAVDFKLGWVDHSGEFSSTGFRIQEAAGDDYTTAIATAAIVADAFAVVSLCNRANLSLSKMIETDTPTPPASVWAQRELGLKIFLVDTVTGDKSTLTIPGPDLELLDQATTDEVDITTALAPGTVLKAALDASLASALGNPVSVYRMRIIGRRN
jgi:hypothetical protein